MKVLFIGGTGIISSGVSPLAVEKGHSLYLLNRGRDRNFVPVGANLIVADINDHEDVAAKLDSYDFDVVVDFIGFKPEDVERDLKLFAGKIKQYIFISSASCYNKQTAGNLIDESTPLYNPYWDYAQDKIACEDRLMKAHREEGFPVTIIRPSLTYGKKMVPFVLNSWSKPYTLIDRIMNGKEIIVPGDGVSPWGITHNTDLAKGLVGLIGNMQAIGHAFNISTDEVLSWNEIIECIGEAVGVKPKPVHISSDFITHFMPDKVGTLVGDKVCTGIIDSSKIKRFVPDFTISVPFREGVKESVNWFQKNPEKQVIDEELNAALDHVIAAYKHGLSYIG